MHGPALPIALHASGAPVPDAIHILPAGAITGRDGRSFHAASLERIIAASLRAAPGQTLPIDYDHQIDLAPKAGGQAPAAGWIKHLEPRADGIWARVEWTPRASASIAAREYRFVSPVLLHAKGGEVLQVLRVSLTNNPNLTQLASLNAAGNPMNLDQLLAALREPLHLPTDADANAVIEAVRAGAPALNAPDPARFVPIEMFEKAVTEANKASAGLSRQEAERAVDNAIRDRRLMPWMRDWAVSLCAVNAPAFADFVGKVGQPLHGFFEMLGKPTDFSAHAAEDRQRAPATTTAIAARLGLSAEDLAKYGN